MGGETFELTVRVEIRRTDDQGRATGDRLSMGQDLALKAGSMLELFQILTDFNVLAKEIRENQADTAADAHRS